MQTRLDKKSVLINWIALQYLKQGKNLDEFKYPVINIHKVTDNKPIRSISQFPQIPNSNDTHNPFVIYRMEGGHFNFREYAITEDKQYKLVYQYDIYIFKK